MFRASNDKGQTFGDKINLSNTTDANSTRLEIDSDANSVVVTWWETNETSDTPVMKVSNDFGKTYRPLLKLAGNRTIASGEVKPGIIDAYVSPRQFSFYLLSLIVGKSLFVLKFNLTGQER